MGAQERRLTKRKTLERLTYIGLPFHNGGIVTDVSEGGLGFHAVAPVENGVPIPFWFSGGAQKIAGVGELMWADSKRKIGGLRFTDIPEEVRKQIRSWPLESNLRFSSGKATGQGAPAMDQSPSANRPLPASRALATPDVLDTARIVSAPQAPPKSADPSSNSSAFSSYAPYYPQAVSPETPLGRRSSRLLKAIGVSTLAGLIGVASYLCYREGRVWLGASKSSGAHGKGLQGLTQAPAPTPYSEGSLVSSADAGESGPGATLAQGARQAAGNGAAGSGAAVTAAPGTPPASDAKPQEQQAAATAQTPPAGSEFLFVQVAAYTNEADAFTLVNRLRQQQIVAFISPPVTDGYYRVQLGPYTTPEAARIGQSALQKVGFKPFIRH